jgi:tetratricopeptide (TPR) repeat protein
VCQILTGLGGVGKTQLAANLAHRLWRDQQIDLLVWVTATSRNRILATYADAAADLIGVDNKDPQASARLLAWLASTDRRWLIVLDDLTEAGDLTDLWPPENAAAGRTLVTTRRRDDALRRSGRQVIDVDVFTPQEAVAYLEHRLKECAAALDHQRELAADLGYLPLALAQAAAYIADRQLTDRQLTCGRYRQMLAERHTRLADLLPEDHALPDDHTATVAATWSLSIELADHLRPAGLARPMLTLAAVLDPNGIPAVVLTAPAALAYFTTHRIIGGSPVNADTALQALAGLHRLSMVRVDIDQPAASLRIHALVQRVTRDQLTDDEEITVARTAADALLQVWPDIERDTALAHALRANTTALQTTTGDALFTIHTPIKGWRRLILRRLTRDPLLELHPVLSRTGNSLGNAGQVSAARDYFYQLWTLANQHLGAGHRATMDILADYARWRGQAGDAAGAAAALELLLPLQVRVRGANHAATLAARGNLARWWGEAGHPADAVIACKDVLADELRVLGPDHPHVLGVRGNLAFWQGKAGDVASAVAAFEELLTDCLRVPGPDDPTTLDVRHNLAFFHGEAGDGARAVAAYEELLADKLRVLGPNHPTTLIIRHNLASWRDKAGDGAGAFAEYQELLADECRVLGPGHPTTLTTRDELARCQGKVDQDPE